MSVRMRKFLACRRAFARLENRLFSWAWVGGKCACWRPIKSYRTIVKGKKKGQIEVELYDPLGKKKIVLKNHVRYRDKEN